MQYHSKEFRIYKSRATLISGNIRCGVCSARVRVEAKNYLYAIYLFFHLLPYLARDEVESFLHFTKESRCNITVKNFEFINQGLP